MRLALLGLNYAPEPVGIGPYTHGLAQGLAAAGWQMEVVTARPYYPGWSVPPQWRGWGWRRETAEGVRVTRCPLYVPRRPTGVRRVLHHLSFAAAALGPMLAAARRRPEVVLVVAPSLLSVPVAWLAARIARAPLWIHVQDFEVEAAVATGLVAAGRVQRLALRCENRLLRGATLVSTISAPMAARLVGKGVAPDRVRELRNWAEPGWAPTPGGAARYRTQWRLGARAVALYSGNLANKQGVGLLVEAARRLAHRPDIAVVICGEGPTRSALEQAAAGLPNVQLHPLQPAERMGDLLALADVHLLPQLPDAADLVLPSKLANMLRSGRPVIATARAGTGLHAEVEGCGVAVPPGDPAALADAIAALVDDAPRRARLGEAARARTAVRWDQAAILARFAATARALAESGLRRGPLADSGGKDAQGQQGSMTDTAARRRRSVQPGRARTSLLQSPCFGRWLAAAMLALTAIYLGWIGYSALYAARNFGPLHVGMSRAEVRYFYGAPAARSGDDRGWTVRDGDAVLQLGFSANGGLATSRCTAAPGQDGAACPGVLGVQLGQTEDVIWDRLGAPTAQSFRGDAKVMHYPELGARFVLRRVAIVAIEREKRAGTAALAARALSLAAP